MIFVMAAELTDALAYSNGQMLDAADEVGIDPFRCPDNFNLHIPIEDFLPQDL
jgi:hypothetical protein